MSDLFIRQLVNHISAKLPVISNAVNGVLNYINEHDKINGDTLALIELIAPVTTDILDSSFDPENPVDEKDYELYKLYLEGRNQLTSGLQKIIVLLSIENGFSTPNIDRIAKRFKPEETTIDSSIGNLFDGARKIAEVVDLATEK